MLSGTGHRAYDREACERGVVILYSSFIDYGGADVFLLEINISLSFHIFPKTVIRKISHFNLNYFRIIRFSGRHGRPPFL